jgi:periplasmic protein TonB
VAGTLNLIPSELKRVKTPSGSQEPLLQPGTALPRFGRPALLMPDNFWSNLKQFLFERPVKVKGDYRSPLMPSQYGGGLADNLKEFFSSQPVPKGPVNSRLSVAWGANFGGFGDRIHDFFSPPKQAPLPPGIKPVKVKEIWSKDENFGWTQVISIGLHAGLILLLVVPFFAHFPPPTEAKNKVDVTPLDISPYMAKLPAGAKQAGGGGGANDHTTTPVNKGKLPKFKMTQFTPPMVHPLQNPKMPMDPSLLGPPDLRVANPNLPTFGDPMANGVSDSLGHGNGTGIGSGTGGGLGPGEGGGTGGGAFRAGVNGVGTPSCIYCPEPPYSDEARKAKWQGTVVLNVIITADGRAISITPVKDPGLGLAEKAIEAVRQWKFKPAVGPNGKPVNVSIPIEVTFRLF